MTGAAFQDRMWPGNLCWGCGPKNPDGLHLKSHWDGDEAVATFVPAATHTAGPTHVLNGGIIATIIDCHCVCTAIAAAYRAEGREIGTDPPIWCVTGSLQVSYLRPTPIDQPVVLRATVAESQGRKTRVLCSVRSGSEECARGDVLAVRVSEEWRGSDHRP